ncbi:Os03g0182600 [Oryza sativa Japonica Group]|uniref:Os03g0182600 protein n=1 Tax=Oryza sativa subsp. japonica TaxID=39947 RepID=A0A0P0VTX8_ORYSJ|nr:Os03g0182600 [Oryza sativa Japonica Group]
MAAVAGGAARALSQAEQDVQMMLAADVHLGTKNCDFQMERYVYKRRSDGIYIINLGKTWEKLQLAARVIVAIENPQDIIVQSARHCWKAYAWYIYQSAPDLLQRAPSAHPH